MARLAFFLFVSAAAISVTPVDGQEVADKRPTKIWNLTGPLGETPKRVTDAYPLSDQDNKGGWIKFEPMSDEFEGQELDLNKWNRGMYWWKGRQPALFSDKNVTVSDGKLHLTMRKEQVPEEFEKLGYKDYTSAALHTKVRSSYGYYEVKAKPMNSGGSSSFWFQVEDTPGWLTEIDVFEIGGKAQGFEHKYNMKLHVFRTPQEKKHWSVGGVWEAPWRFADDYHVFGLDWGKDELKYYVDGVLVRSVENTHWHQPTLFDLRQRDDARVVWNAGRQGLAFHLQRRIRTGVEGEVASLRVDPRPSKTPQAKLPDPYCRHIRHIGHRANTLRQRCRLPRR